MLPCLAGNLCLNSCPFSVLVTVLLVVKAQATNYSQWKPIQWYLSGNITFGTSVSKLDEISKNDPASWKGSKWKQSYQESIYRDPDAFLDTQEEVPTGSFQGQESRSVADENLGDIAETLRTTAEDSGESVIPETKEDEEQSRKKKKKLLKKLALPLLVLYKIKFLMLIPVLVASVVLLSGSSGLAGFFFALFATMMAYGKEH